MNNLVNIVRGYDQPTDILVHLADNPDRLDRPVTAKGRSLPALICSMEEGMLSNMTCTWPAMRSVANF